MAKSSGKSSKTTAKKSTKAKVTKKKAPAKKAKRKVMDISKPGKTRAESTAKPVIVGHKPMVQDPMMAPASTSEAPKAPATPPAPSASKKVITPLSGDKKPDEKSAQNADKPAEEQGMIPNLPDLEHALAKDRAKDSEAPGDESTPDEETATTEEVSSSDPEVSDENVAAAEAEAPEVTPEPEVPAKEVEESKESAAVVDTLLGQLDDKKQQSKEEALAKEQEQHINKLVEQKKYFIPVAKAKRRRRRRYIAFVLAVVLLLGTLAAADAGIIPGVEPPFGWLSSETASDANDQQNSIVADADQLTEDELAPAETEETDVSPEPRTFTFEEYGFSFDFTTNEEVTIVDGVVQGVTNGTPYSISLVADKMAAGFVTKDFRATGDFLGFTQYRACTNPLVETEGEFTVYSDDNSCVKVIATNEEEGENGVSGKLAYLVAQYSFSDNEITAGLEFTHAPVTIEDYEEATIKAAYSPEITERFVNIIKSVKEL